MLTANKMAIAIAKAFNWRVNMIVPNVSWGFFIHECDILVVTKAGYCYEIEIKCSMSDLKRDALKRHGHISKRIRKLYFAVTDKMKSALEHIPDRAGLFVVSENGYCKKVREAQTSPDVDPLTIDERLQVARLGVMRTWNLRSNIQGMYNELYRRDH